ncbi:MAG: fasciclin domain-containing protein [Planctomycetota bacterium]
MNSLKQREAFAPLLFASLALVACSDSDSGTTQPGVQTQPIVTRLSSLGLTTLVTAIDAAGLTNTLNGPGTFTLFAPTNDAFNALPAGTLQFLLDPANQAALVDVLTYHALSGSVNSAAAAGLASAMSVQGDDVLIDAVGGELYINDARVTMADVAATNGVIHVIDAVLTPPATVVETLQARGFNTLVAAVGAAGLTGALNGGMFTVLAPTDAAFAALPAGVLADLLLPQNQAQLVSILQFHLIPGAQKATELVGAGERASAEGPLQFFGLGAAGATVGTTAIERFNLPATDGLIHVVSDVLLPQGDIVERAVALNFGTLAQLVTDAGLVPTLQGTGPFTVFAPTDAAFAALPTATLTALMDPVNIAALQQVLTYHVVPGALQASEVIGATSLNTVEGSAITVDASSGVVLNGASNVITTDVFADNGVIHAIDTVLIPPGFNL